MKNKEFTKIALMGLASGLLISNELSAAGIMYRPHSQTRLMLVAEALNPAEGNLGYHVMTEEELLLELNTEGAKDYENLTPEGKRLARVVASQRCNGTNECANLASCKTDKHECAGKNTCKGTTICAIGDKNLAIRLVKNKMAMKREQLTSATPTKPTTPAK
jgi:hypothetical protein